MKMLEGNDSVLFFIYHYNLNPYPEIADADTKKETVAVDEPAESILFCLCIS